MVDRLVLLCVVLEGEIGWMDLRFFVGELEMGLGFWSVAGWGFE